MNSRFHHQLRRIFGVEASPTDRYSANRIFQVYDRKELKRLGPISFVPDGIRDPLSSLWTPETFCEVYVYGGPTEESFVLEMTNVYPSCRSTVTMLMNALSGTVDAATKQWVARGVVPLSKSGVNTIRHFAEHLREHRRKGTKYGHRILTLSQAMDKLANAVLATVLNEKAPTRVVNDIRIDDLATKAV